jgi:hypothetical protein
MFINKRMREGKRFINKCQRILAKFPKEGKYTCKPCAASHKFSHCSMLEFT